MSDISVATLKNKLRRDFLGKRRGILPQIRLRASELITELLTSHSLFTSARSIFTYLSLDDEVSTVTLHELALPSKQVFVPKMMDDEIVPVPFTRATKLTVGKFGILEPDGDFTATDTYNFDLIIIPGVCFDREGNRLGMGKGYFDRFLKKCSGTVVAVAFDFQIVDKIPTHSYDVPVSFIFTPHEIITCKPTSTIHRL